MGSWSIAANRRARLLTRGGFNILEILLALAIFSVGLLEVLAVFPPAGISGARAVYTVQGRVLHRTAVDECRLKLYVPLFQGRISGPASLDPPTDTIPA